jgi:DNA processing protein
MTPPGRRDEREAWIGLASTPGVGDVTFERLLAAWGDASTALEAVARLDQQRADQVLAGAIGSRRRAGLAAAVRATAADPGRPERAMTALGGWVLTPLDGAWPPRLHELEEPPPVIFGLGSQASLVAPRLVAVVGTRHPTGLGRGLAARIGTRLAQAGATVVSGLAVGIDGAAHQAALEAGGASVGVVGGGLDEPGPVAHRRLARRLAAQGAVISEQPPGVRPTAGTFPRRNRIVSALAAATLVVEAPARSGALITARHALEQGRLVLVAPGRPLDPSVAGNLALLRESPARPLTGLDEMLVDLGLDGVAEMGPAPGARLSAAAALDTLPGPQRAVAEALCRGPQTVDSLAVASQQAPGIVAAALTLLQLRGWATCLGALLLPAGPLLEQREGTSGGTAPGRPSDGHGPGQRRMGS